MRNYGEKMGNGPNYFRWALSIPNPKLTPKGLSIELLAHFCAPHKVWEKVKKKIFTPSNLAVKYSWNWKKQEKHEIFAKLFILKVSKKCAENDTGLLSGCA